MIYHFSHYGPEGSRDVIERIERMLPMLDMFFIISGFLIFEAYRDRIGTAADYFVYLARRFARIYPLHIATLGFFAAIGMAGHFGFVQTGGGSRYDLSQVLPNLLLVQAWGVSRELSLNYVSWSLSAEWLCYLLLPVIVLFHRGAGLAGLVLLLAIVVATLEILTMTGVMPFKSWLKADTWGAWRAFADFIVGALIATAARAANWRLRSHWPAWLMIIVAIATMQMQWPVYASYALMAFALFLAAVGERNTPERARWLEFAMPVAIVSFGIYMWHPVIETLTYQILWPRFVAPTGVNFYVFMLFPMVASILLAMASFHTYERWTGRLITQSLGGARLRPARLPAPGE